MPKKTSFTPAFLTMYFDGFFLSLETIHFLKVGLYIFNLWLHWVSIALWGPFLAVASEGCSLLLCRFLCSGFSCCRAQTLEHIGFSSCSTWAQQLWHRGLVALRYVGSSPIRDRTALAGRFLFTVPPGDSLKLGFIFVCAQSFLTLCNPMDCSLPGSSVHGILQGIFPSQGPNSCLQHWQVDSLLLRHLGF